MNLYCFSNLIYGDIFSLSFRLWITRLIYASIARCRFMPCIRTLLRQSQVWMNEEGATESRMWKRWNAHSSSSLSKNKAFRLSHGTFTRMNAVWECECHFWVMMPLPCWTFYLWILDALPVPSLDKRGGCHMWKCGWNRLSHVEAMDCSQQFIVK